LSSSEFLGFLGVPRRDRSVHSCTGSTPRNSEELRGTAFLALLLFTACASQPPAPRAPEWDAIPAGVVEALCARLHNEGVSSAVIVNTTQPIATERAAVALAGTGRRRASGAEVVEALRHAQKSVPIVTPPMSSCEWNAIPLAQRRSDQMAIELSAPLPNPFIPNTAGLFVRLSLGGEHASWYWVTLVPQGGGWTVAAVNSLAL
jgi:hypothetical protein